MDLKLDQPHVRIYDDRGNVWCVPSNLAPALQTALLHDHAWFVCADIWGQPLMLRLANVITTIERTDAARTLLNAEDDEEKDRARVASYTD